MKFEERSLKARRAETIDKREEHRNGMDLEGENRSEREREEEAFATDIHRSAKLLGIIATTLQQALLMRGWAGLGAGADRNLSSQPSDELFGADPGQSVWRVSSFVEILRQFYCFRCLSHSP
jgi:hypothetical protein